MAGIRIHPLLKCPVCAKKYSATYMEKHIQKHSGSFHASETKYGNPEREGETQ